MVRAAPPAVDRARNGDGPASSSAAPTASSATRGDPATYRKPGELEQLAAARPAQARTRRAGREAGVPASVLEEADGTAREEVTRAFEAALAADPAPRCGRCATATRTQPLNFRDAIRQALIEELERDPRVLLFGEDVARAGGVFKVTRACRARRAPSGCSTRRSPSSPSPAPASGRPSSGSGPVIEIMFGDFMALAMDSLINQSAK